MSSQPLYPSHNSNDTDCINQIQAPTSSNSTSSGSIDTAAPTRFEPTAGSGSGTIEARDTDTVREKETGNRKTTMGNNSSDNINLAHQWYFTPSMQPSTISTTATSTLMPTTAPTIGSTAPKLSLAKPGRPCPMALPTKAPASLYASLQGTLAPGTLVGIGARPQGGAHTATAHSTRTTGPYSSHPSHIPSTPLHINTQTTLPPIKDLSTHNNPYRSPSHTNSRAFIPPKVPGYEFPGGGSQAGNMGLMLGRRLSDGVPVTAKLHQSRVLLQHEYRIYKRLKMANARYDPNCPPLTQSDVELESNHQQGSQQLGKTESSTSATTTETPPETHQPKSSHSGSVYEAGSDESEKFFLRIVHDFIDLDHDDMSVLMLERLGPNLLSHTHHQFLGLEDDGMHCPETQPKLSLGSPFPDVYTFLVFALKAACMLEGLLEINLAHLAICPTALHWMPAETNNEHSGDDGHQQSDPVGSKSYTYPSSTSLPRSQPSNPNSEFYAFLKSMDVNNTKIRLFDFTHSKILSHERARAPNNIVEWQIPGYLEYHLQFLAPEQTGRAETWMDHRTDIYGLGASLFSLLTMQFPYTGQDSVQILQGVLSKELPPLRDFRPDMPPVIDDILRKMTQKQPSQRYQNAFGFKQDILRCLNELHRTGRINSFELGKHDMSYQFVLPNTVIGRQSEQQLISAAIVQAANAYQHSLNNVTEDADDDDDGEIAALRVKVANNSDHYVFMDDIVPLQNQGSTKIPLSSKMLLRTPKPIGGSKSVLRGTEINDPVIRVIFVRGPSGVGKTVLIRGIAAVARNSGLFAGGMFEAEGSAPYSAILQCIQSVLQQLLAQHTNALASLIVTIRTAFEPNSGIGIICDLIPELKFFFAESEIPECKDVPLTHSVARFHALILKLIRVISTHFFMTWLIDDLDFADESSIDLLATLVNVNKRLPIILIITHTDTIECLMKVKHILGGGNHSGTQFSAGFGALGTVHHDSVVDDLSSKGHPSSSSSSSFTSMSKTTAIRASGQPMVVRGGGGVRYIPLQNPSMETIQEFLATALHRNKEDVISLAKVLYGKTWLTVRQLVLELYKNHTIHFSCQTRQWEWESCPVTLAEVIRQLTGEEYAFLEGRFRALDSDTRRTLICASICGPVFTIQDLQQLVAATYSWEDDTSHTATDTPIQSQQSTSSSRIDVMSEKANRGCNAMAGLQTAIQDGILVYTSVADRLRFQHGVMRRVAIDLIESREETERLHFEMAKILLNAPTREFRTANHILQCLDLIKSTLVTGSQPSGATIDATTIAMDCGSDALKPIELDVRAVRMILSHAGEKSQKSGAQDMALAYWNAALSLLPENCWNRNPEDEENDVKDGGQGIVMQDAGISSNPTSPETLTEGFHNPLWQQQSLYNEALKLHLQCIEAERWRENYDQAMKICEIVLANVSDPIDRARVYQHQIEMLVWAYSAPEKATATAIKSLLELGMPEDVVFDPTMKEIREIFDQTHAMLLQHMPELQKQPPKVCSDPTISMMMEILVISSASLYYSNASFIAAAIAQSMKLICEHGIAKVSGRALVSFALTYSTWYGCYDNAYELGKLACAVSNGDQRVRYLFYFTVQQWGEHVAHSITAMEESLTAVEINCDRVFHVAGMIHISIMKLLIARVPLKEMMANTIELLAKNVEFGPKSNGVEIMQGILQLIKCLKGRTLAGNPETILDDADFSEPSSSASSSSSLLLGMLSKHPQAGKPAAKGTKGDEAGSGVGRCGKKKKKKTSVLAQSNRMYRMLVALAAFIFGHYAYVEEISSVWHDDPKSIMNFEGSWIVHTVLTIVGLTLLNLLRTEKDPEVRRRHKERLFCVYDRMEMRANKFATNNAAMYYLLKAEIADQGLIRGGDEQGDDNRNVKDLKTVLLLYEKAIQFSTEGDFPMQKCFAHEFAAQCHLRHGLVTSARCLMRYACKEYQVWGANGKVQWFYHTFPDIFPSTSQEDFSKTTTRGLFYRSNERNYGNASCPGYPLPTHGPEMTGASSLTGPLGFNHNSTRVSTAASSVSTNTDATEAAAAAARNGGSTSPWVVSSSPSLMYNTSAFGHDVISAAGIAMTESNIASSQQSISGGGAVPVPANAASSTSSSMAPLSSESSSTCSSSYSSLSAPLYSLQNTWLNSPPSPEMDNADFDVLDFSSVIEAMQVIASEIDLDLLLVKSLGVLNQSVSAKRCCLLINKDDELVLAASLGVAEDGRGDNDTEQCWFVNPPMEVKKCGGMLFHGVINYVVNTSAPCLLTNAKDDPRFCADEYLLKHRSNLKTVLCAPILHKAVLVGVLYMEEFPERAFANKRMVVMNLLVQQLGISITNALLYQSVLQSESKLNGLLENMPCGIALWDATAETCQYINSTWNDMTGYTVEEILQSGWGNMVHQDEVVQSALAWKEHVQAGMPCQWETRYGLKDGTFRWGVVRMLPIVSNSEPKKILQWLTVTIDIDDQRRAVQLKSNFLANMSHELRTPFSGILGMLSLLRDSSGLSSEQFEFVDMAKASCEMLIRIVDDLLNFSKLEADKVTLEYIPLCFEEILGDVCDLLVPLASKKGLELITLADDTLPTLLIGDPDRMKQILMNLIGNAIKFSTSGNIVIKYWHERRKREPVDPMQVILHEPLRNFLDAKYAIQDQGLQTSGKLPDTDESQLGDEIVLHCSVTDQGIGMSPEERKMLFVSFQQTDSGTTRKYGGTGLGLSICAQLIAHMKGQITVESEKGHGSTFTFTANLQSMTNYDREQNPIESARILDGESLLNAKCNALLGKRVLILSPNRLLREQIIRAAPKAEYMEFDDLISAVKAGAIGIHCEESECVPNMTMEEPNTSGNKDSGSTCCVSEASGQGVNLNMGTDSKACSSKSKTVNCKPFCAMGLMSKICFARLQELLKSSASQKQISQYDFILVDHVLDSAELDCIYPSPSVAFVLLLGPTTETLRWILPPAEKRIYEELDECDSGQVDVGGRDRIQQRSESEFAEKAKGQIRSTSYMTKIAKGSDCPMHAEGDKSASIFNAGACKLPSQLFKRKKSSGDHSAGLKRQRDQGCSAGSDGNSSNVNHSRSGTGSSSPSSNLSFQVVRMIKPVRRIKLLQIMHNALVLNEDQQWRQRKMSYGDYEVDQELEQHVYQELEDQAELSEASDGDEELIERGGTPGGRSQTVTSGTMSSPALSRSASPTSFLSVAQCPTSQKRRRSKDSGRTECTVSNDVIVPPHKAAKAKVSPASGTMSNKRTATRSRTSTCSSSSSSKDQQDERQSHVDGNFPKRARNNDALTLLLTSEELERSQGINVLVAEDDYVSQKILEKQLSKLGMNVVIANNGQEAVDRWLAVERGYYTIAIFDHHMPIMDGLAATKKIRELEAMFAEEDQRTRAQGDEPPGHQIRIPIVGLSADIQLATKEKCIKGGMDEYMTKPLLTQGLALLIQRYCCG